MQVFLDGETLSPETLVQLQSGSFTIDLTPEAWKRVAAGREVIDNIVRSGEVAYGINTGFGLFSNVRISPDKLVELQENLIRSHSAGTGEPLSPARTRMLLALRANVLAKGHSGITIQVLKQLLAAFNAGCLAVVPAKGTVGASGDLAPLSHLALGLMGEGQMWDPRTGHTEQRDAAEVLAAHGLTPIKLSAKEGLALINGTQMIASLGSEALVRAERVTNTADCVCALTLEVLKGTVSAFHPAIHRSRPHRGQGRVAARLRALIHPGEPSEISRDHKYCDKVQDAYALRCAPQVHGVTHDTLTFVRSILEVELNSATDNPMVFTGSPSVDAAEDPSAIWPPTPSISAASKKTDTLAAGAEAPPSPVPVELRADAEGKAEDGLPSDLSSALVASRV